VGAVVFLGSTLLHPLGADPNDPEAAFAEYAAAPSWVWSHLGQFLGVAVLGVALVALAGTLEPGPAAGWGRVGVIGTAAFVAGGAALQAVDGVALKVMVDRWAAATGQAQERAFEAAFAVRQVEIGLASLFSIVAGLTLLAFGVALSRSSRYAAWLGGLGLLSGLGLVASGAAQASAGFSGVAMTLSMVASAVLLLWVALVAVHMWRLAPLPGDAEEMQEQGAGGALGPNLGQEDAVVHHELDLARQPRLQRRRA
jgi:hypothetical protein